MFGPRPVGSCALRSAVRDGADLIDLVLLPHSREQGRFPALPDQKDQPAHTGQQRESPTAWGTAQAPEDSPGAEHRLVQGNRWRWRIPPAFGEAQRHLVACTATPPPAERIDADDERRLGSRRSRSLEEINSTETRSCPSLRATQARNDTVQDIDRRTQRCSESVQMAVADSLIQLG